MLGFGAAAVETRKVGKVEGGAVGTLAAELDRAELVLIFADIVRKGIEKTLGMLRRHHDAAADLGFGNAGEHRGEIDDEFAVGVGDNREVGIVPLGDLGLQFEADLVVVIVCHNSVRLIVSVLHSTNLVKIRDFSVSLKDF